MEGNGNTKPENRKTHKSVRSNLKKKGGKDVISRTVTWDQRRPMFFQLNICGGSAGEN